MRFTPALVLFCALCAPAFAVKHTKVEVKTTLRTAGGEDAGTATFVQKDNGKVKVTLDLKNLPVGAHGVHLHKVPMCEAPDFKSAGPHFNPEMKQHGFENPMGHHEGDLPQNLMVGEDHKGKVSFEVDYLSLGTGQPNDILANGGTSILVHASADDMKTDPSGNSGARIACGVIAGKPATPAMPPQ